MKTIHFRGLLVAEYDETVTDIAARRFVLKIYPEFNECGFISGDMFILANWFFKIGQYQNGEIDADQIPNLSLN